MTRQITIYCPDRHLAYDVRTLDRQGVGGGITSRIRLAHALAALGHRVTACVNCPDEASLDGVRYQHFSKLKQAEADVFIASTSGGVQDVSALGGISIQAGLRLLMVHGTAFPRGAERQPFDFICAPSNFIRDVAVERWGQPPERLFVCQRGVTSAHFQTRWGRAPRRDPFAIAYAGHPSKGLNEAIAVLRLLRAEDPRFTLHVFGGHGLWGGEEQPIASEEGVVYHGLIGQKKLARELLGCGFSLNLQSREEPFGLVIVESMRAGCIVLASPVGAYPEIIHHGYDGLLIPGPCTEASTQARAANWILELTRRPDYADYLRRNALAAPFDWETVARAWAGHWDWALSGKPTASLIERACAACGGSALPLADGLHCIRCGRYQRSLAL